jgi:hypothetical protein
MDVELSKEQTWAGQVLSVLDPRRLLHVHLSAYAWVLQWQELFEGMHLSGLDAPKLEYSNSATNL